MVFSFRVVFFFNTNVISDISWVVSNDFYGDSFSFNTFNNFGDFFPTGGIPVDSCILVYHKD